MEVARRLWIRREENLDVLSKWLLMGRLWKQATCVIAVGWSLVAGIQKLRRCQCGYLFVLAYGFLLLAGILTLLIFYFYSISLSLSEKLFYTFQSLLRRERGTRCLTQAPFVHVKGLGTWQESFSGSGTNLQLFNALLKMPAWRTAVCLLSTNSIQSLRPRRRKFGFSSVVDYFVQTA